MKSAIRTACLLLSACLLLVTSAGALQNSRAGAAQRLPLTADQLKFLSHVSMVDLPDGLGGFVRTVRISGINVQIVNDSGTTDGNPDGLGNLIIGYNELRGAGDDHTGSHNLVTGRRNNYKSFGGLVAGSNNEVSGAWSSVNGGFRNSASANNSSVSGGFNNSASGDYASVSGGFVCAATGVFSSVSGGGFNIASGAWSSVSGGFRNTAYGGESSVSGGRYNTASGRASTVSGGRSRSATRSDQWAAGSLVENN